MSFWNPQLLLFLSINVYEHIPANNTKKKKNYKNQLKKHTFLMKKKNPSYVYYQ